MHRTTDYVPYCTFGYSQDFFVTVCLERIIRLITIQEQVMLGVSLDFILLHNNRERYFGARLIPFLP
jgi:hypothetical protein